MEDLYREQKRDHFPSGSLTVKKDPWRIHVGAHTELGPGSGKQIKGQLGR